MRGLGSLRSWVAAGFSVQGAVPAPTVEEVGGGARWDGGGCCRAGYVKKPGGDPVSEVGWGEAETRLAKVGPVVSEGVRSLVPRDADMGRDPVNTDSPVGFGFPIKGSDSADQKSVAIGDPPIFEEEGGISTVGEDVEGMTFGRVLQKGINGHADGEKFTNVVGALTKGRSRVDNGSTTVSKRHLEVEAGPAGALGALDLAPLEGRAVRVGDKMGGGDREEDKGSVALCSVRLCLCAFACATVGSGVEDGGVGGGE